MNRQKYYKLTGNKVNMFSFCKNNTEIHEDMKFKVFKELIKKGLNVYTEVEFKDKKRADIIAFDIKGFYSLSIVFLSVFIWSVGVGSAVW